MYLVIADINTHNDFYKRITHFAKLYAHMSSYKFIGFYGQPDNYTIDIFKHFGFPFIDLDINFKYPNYKIVPDVYCHIIRDIVNNAIHLKDKLATVICTTGKDKCDQGRAVFDMLNKLEFKVIDASNKNTTPLRKPIISKAKGNLKSRVIRIMELIYKPLTDSEIEYYNNNQCIPVCNFHGTPPHDIDLLELFPDETHIEGWTRLVEMAIPAVVSKEWEIETPVPTVYFAQSFCNKQMLASFMANKHNDMYVDGHGSMTASSKAKLEAFITLKTTSTLNNFKNIN